MNLLLPRSDRRRLFLLSDFQSNALHGDINKTLKTLLSPFFLTSTAAKPLNNAAVPLRTFLSGNTNPSKRCRRPPLIPLRKHKPLKTSPQASATSSSSLKQAFRRVSVESPPPPPRLALDRCTSVEHLLLLRVAVEPKALIMSEINEPSPTSKR